MTGYPWHKGDELDAVDLNAAFALAYSGGFGSGYAVPEAFGARGDGATDDIGAFNVAFSAGIRVLHLRETSRYYLGSSLTVPPGCSIVGNYIGRAAMPLGFNPYSLGSQITMGPGATIMLSAGSLIERVLLTRGGLAFPMTVATAAAVVGTFADDAVVCIGADARASECTIFGFARAFVSIGWARVVANYLRIDCAAGIYISGGADISEMLGCVAYPFLTASFMPVGDKSLRRLGDAFTFAGNCDWSKGDSCFSYGFARGFVRDGCSNVGWLNCKVDYTNPNNGSDGGLANVCGFANVNATTYAYDTDCTAVAQQIGIDHATTVPNGGTTADANGAALTVSGGLYASSGVNMIAAGTGGIFCDNARFVSGSAIAQVAAGTGKSSFRGVYMGALGTDFVIDPSLAGLVEIDVLRDGPGNYFDNIINNVRVGGAGVQGIVQALESRNIASGIGGAFKFQGPYFSGVKSYGGFRASLYNANAGFEATDLIWSTMNAGTEADRWKLTNDGQLVPVADNTYSLGTVTLRMRETHTNALYVNQVYHQTGGGLGFYGATPVGKPTVTGAKSGNGALGSLLATLVAMGLVTDGTTA